MSLTALIGQVSAVIAAVVAGVFAILAKRQQSHGPQSVAGGYSTLVGDMRKQQAELQKRLGEVEALLQQERSKSAEERAKLEIVTRQVEWLLSIVTAEQKQEFEQRFAGSKNYDTGT